MDDGLCKDILRTVRRIGVDDIAIVRQTKIIRKDFVGDSSVSPDIEHPQSLVFYANIDGAVASCDLLMGQKPVRDLAALQNLAENAIRGARIAHAWGVSKSVKSLRDLILPMTAKNCPSPRTAPQNPISPQNDAKCPALGQDGYCQNSCFSPSCLENVQFNASPFLTSISERIKNDYPSLLLSASQKTEDIRTTVFLPESDMIDTRQAVSTIRQTLISRADSGSFSLCLPAFQVDDMLLSSDAPELAYCLRADELALDFLRGLKTETTAEQAPNNIHHVVLSPWASAVLLHEAHHLGAQIAKSGQFVLDASSCLMVPVNTLCQGFALRSASGDLNAAEMRLENVSDRCFVVDAPIRWIRRNHRLLDVTFAIAAMASNHQIDQVFRALTLRFDLSNMWNMASAVCAPAKRIALKCRGLYTSVETPWIDAECLSLQR